MQRIIGVLKKLLLSPYKQWPAQQRQMFFNEIDLKSIRRARNFNLVFFIFNTITLIFFSIPFFLQSEGLTREYYWLTTSCDFILSCGTLATFLIATLTMPRSAEKVQTFHRGLIFANAFFIMGIGSVITSITQIQSGAITVYILSVLGVGAILYLRKTYLVFIYGIPFIAFVIGQTIFQSDMTVRMNNIVNGTLLMIIGAFISRMLFNNAVNDFAYRCQIEKQKLEIEEEKELLKRRNESIEKELELARRLQLKMIPTETPNSAIAAYYQPMDRVGGDFYDFIRFSNGDIGIFLSDVSGHGVPAAFVTSMIKSMLLQVAPVIDNPAELLHYLNEMLFNNTDGNFITVFYGIYSPENKHFVYSNAGHNPPYLIDRRSVMPLVLERSGIPIGILNNKEIAGLNKEYRNNSVSLENSDKLLLYTDGFTETVNLNKNEGDFETLMLDKTLLLLSNLTPQDFICKLIAELTKFHGSPDFEDDICLICMQLGKSA